MRQSNSQNIYLTAIQQMKEEIANEFGIQLGPDTSSRLNGTVGGEITRRLVSLAQQHLIK